MLGAGVDVGGDAAADEGHDGTRRLVGERMRMLLYSLLGVDRLYTHWDCRDHISRR